ncbi:CGNR zinc finger domain-containing protein [Herbiconiux sp. P17]|uniref:CGNR zinc finger domain-containing protein n=1 Tax=Herbiconiux wuyangfengii TaxID=3342794 RepID=UPI0035B9AC7D
MSYPATERYDLVPAPGGVVLVQELVNSTGFRPALDDDLLADVERATAWFETFLPVWSEETGRTAPAIELDDEGLEELRALRSELLAALNRQDGAGANGVNGTVGIALAPDGSVRFSARQTSLAKWVRNTAILEAGLSQQIGTWPRLKMCANPPCIIAFYDRSKNRTAAWHDAKTCGNAVNLRASRARRRAAGGEPVDAV